MKAYKVFNSNWACQDFQYEVGKEYKIDSEPILCKRGFHACKKLVDCFNYYDFDSANKVAEVELLGTVLGDNEDKQVTNHIKIVKELTWFEVLHLVNIGNCNIGYKNTGDSNTGDGNAGNYNNGYRNSGDWNTGNSNTGDKNSGNRNTGNESTGDWNNCDKETGFFNSKNSEEIRVFNKPCKISIWENARKPKFIYFFLEEGKTYKECFKNSYLRAKKQDDWEYQKELLLNLPNFDKQVFFEISGIEI